MRVHVKCAKSGIGSPLKLLLKKMEALPNVRLITWNNNSLSPAKAAAATCEHKHVEFFRDSGDSNKGTFYCSGCHKTVTAEEYLDRVDEKLRRMHRLGGNDISVPEDSVNRELQSSSWWSCAASLICGNGR